MIRDHQAEHATRAAEHGLRALAGTGSCPRRLAGLRHRLGCWCEHRLLDADRIEAR